MILRMDSYTNTPVSNQMIRTEMTAPTTSAIMVGRERSESERERKRERERERESEKEREKVKERERER